MGGAPVLALAALSAAGALALQSGGATPPAAVQPEVPFESQPKRQTEVPPLVTPCTALDAATKDLDLLIYGPGFTGKLATLYLVGHPEAPRHAIAGRHRVSMEHVRRLASKNNSNPPQGLVFDLTSPAAAAYVKRARAVVNFAGPFEKNHGERLIRAAINGCTHYVDISEETQWAGLMLRKYGEIAQKRRLALVQSAGFASMASDLIAMGAIEDVAKTHQALPTNVVVVWSSFNDGPSGGQSLTKRSASDRHPPFQDPYILAPEMPDAQKVDWRVDGLEDFGVDDVFGSELVVSPLGQTTCPVVRRSIMQKYPGASISVQEANAWRVQQERTKFLKSRGAEELLEVKENPAPGEGPPLWVLKHGGFRGTAIASGMWSKTKMEEGRRNHVARVTIDGAGDPSFMGSARMAVELALALAEKGPLQGGYLTPTGAIGREALEKRLLRADKGLFVRVTHARDGPL